MQQQFNQQQRKIQQQKSATIIGNSNANKNNTNNENNAENNAATNGLNAINVQEEQLTLQLNEIEKYADLYEVAYRDYNSSQVTTSNSKIQYERALVESSFRKQDMQVKQKMYTTDISMTRNNKERTFNEEEWVKEKDGFTGRTEWKNVITLERLETKPKAKEINGLKKDDNDDMNSKQVYEEAVLANEDAVSYLKIKKAQWMEAKEIESNTYDGMIEMKEKLRDLSIHVLPNIEENDQDDALPLPSPAVVQEWAGRVSNGVQNEDERDGGENGNNGTRNGTAVSDKEQDLMMQQLTQEMEKQVTMVALADKDTNAWAVRAANLASSTKPKLVMKRDGSVETL